MTPHFFTVHQGLDREGPGSADDVRWVAGLVGLPSDARICDAACGPGGDIETWLELVPEGRITAVDAHKPFIDEVMLRFGLDKRVTAYAGNMAKLKGPFDLIWCAGAVYFLGVTKALTVWRPCLRKGGHVAFSEPCFFTERPSSAAREFWDGYDTMDEAGIRSAVAKAGYKVVDARRVADAGWEAYYGPLQARVTALRDGADRALHAELDVQEAEIRDWRAVRDETGYLLLVVRPA